MEEIKNKNLKTRLKLEKKMADKAKLRKNSKLGYININKWIN